MVIAEGWSCKELSSPSFKFESFPATTVALKKVFAVSWIPHVLQCTESRSKREVGERIDACFCPFQEKGWLLAK